ATGTDCFGNDTGLSNYDSIPESWGGPPVSSSSSSSVSDAVTTTTTTPPWILPRLYVSSYTTTGFIVRYENIREDIGYIDFIYHAV
ncbi:hypothetical protein D4R86_01150, partial [bacterium]